MIARRLFALCLCVLSVSVAAAATHSWTGGDASSSNWSAADNWSSAPSPSSADTLLFAGGAARPICTNDSISSIGSIGVSGDGYQLSGGGNLAVTGGGMTFSAPSVGPLLLQTTITAGAPLLFTNTGARVTVGAGGTSLVYSGTNTVTFDGTGDFNLFAQTLGTAGGTLIKQGSNTVNVSPMPNPTTKDSGSYLGALMVSAGTLNLALPGSATNPVTVASGARLLASSINSTYDNPVTLQDGATFESTGFVEFVKTATLNGHVTLRGVTVTGNPLFLSGNGFPVVAPLVDGTGVGSISTLGQLQIGGVSTYSGGSHVMSLGTGRSALITTVADALGSGPVQVDDDTELDCGGGLANAITLGSVTATGRAPTLANTSTAGADTSLTLSGALTLANSRSTTAGSFALGAISGAGSLNTTGDAAAVVLLTGPGSWQGQTVITTNTLRLGGGALPSATPVVDNGVLDLAGHNTTIGSLAGSSSVTLGSATLTSGDNNSSTTFGGVVSGTGGTVWNGSGTQTLTGHNTYGGATVITGSRILLVNGGALAATSAVGVHAGATLALAAAGSVGAVTSTGGTVQIGVAGASERTGASGNLQLDAASMFTVFVDGAKTSQLSVAGTVALAGTLGIEVVTVPSMGQTFVILDNDGGDAVVGTFTGAPEGGVVTAGGGTTFRVSYVGGDGNDVTLTAVMPGQAVDLGAVDLGAPGDLSGADLAAIDLASVDFAAVDLATADLGSVDLGGPAPWRFDQRLRLRNRCACGSRERGGRAARARTDRAGPLPTPAHRLSAPTRFIPPLGRKII